MSLESARQSRMAPAAIKTKFLSDIKNYKDKIFCFYEGDDRKYYNDRIKNVLGIKLSDIQQYKCDGKEGVLDTHRLVNPISKNKGIKSMFFIDKDYIEQSEPIDNIFETNTYSIENYYCNSECFKNVLTTICGLNESEPDYQKAINDFESALKSFNDAVLDFNSWLYHQRKNNPTANVPFHDLTIMKWFNSSSISSIQPKETIDQDFIENQRRFTDSPKIPPAAFQTTKNYVKNNLNPTESFVGKYQIAFFGKYLTLLQNEIANNYFSGHSGINLIGCQNDILTSLSPLADTPKCLIDFISKFA